MLFVSSQYDFLFQRQRYCRSKPGSSSLLSPYCLLFQLVRNLANTCWSVEMESSPIRAHDISVKFGYLTFVFWSFGYFHLAILLENLLSEQYPTLFHSKVKKMLRGIRSFCYELFSFTVRASTSFENTFTSSSTF